MLPPFASGFCFCMRILREPTTKFLHSSRNSYEFQYEHDGLADPLLGSWCSNTCDIQTHSRTQLRGVLILDTAVRFQISSGTDATSLRTKHLQPVSYAHVGFCLCCVSEMVDSTLHVSGTGSRAAGHAKRPWPAPWATALPSSKRRFVFESSRLNTYSASPVDRKIPAHRSLASHGHLRV